MNVEFNNREDWKKGVKIFLENSTIPYEKNYKWPPVIYNDSGDIFFQFNEYIDFIPDERLVVELSLYEQNKIIKLFNVNDLNELIEIFNMRDEVIINSWKNIDKNNIKEEIETALIEIFGYNLITFSQEEYNESMELNELDIEDF